MKLNEDFTARSKLQDLARWHVTRFVRSVADRLPPGTRLLDAGAGECAYKTLFAHCRYVAIDLAVGEARWNYANLDCLAKLDGLPLADGYVDAILCTQVLEHVEWPRETIREFHRVLKPGGVLYLTAPMAHTEHQVPFDYFRYTSFGLRSILEGAGFQAPRIEPFGGLPSRMAYELPRILTLFPSSGMEKRRLRISGLLALPARAATFAAVRLLQSVLVWADRFDHVRNDPFGWSVVARK